MSALFSMHFNFNNANGEASSDVGHSLLLSLLILVAPGDELCPCVLLVDPFNVF